MNIVAPVPAASSVRASTIANAASTAPLMNHLWPLMTHLPS
jgi:hypothetical protein